jgi:type IV pilus assembly protein PilA
MYSFRKSKKGFTLIELMVVVAIIGVLALLGLRLYTGQQIKAKNAIVKANTGTVQTLIQAELADSTSGEVDVMVGAPGAVSDLIEDSGIHVPDGVAQVINSSPDANIGFVYVVYDATSAGSEFFEINGNAFDGGDVYDTPLTARK